MCVSAWLSLESYIGLDLTLHFFPMAVKLADTYRNLLLDKMLLKII